MLDLVRFTRNLEQRINDSLAQVRFVYIPRAIPLEEFGENKKLLDQLAIVFLSNKPTRRPSEEDLSHSNYFIRPFIQPSFHPFIQSISSIHPLSSIYY